MKRILLVDEDEGLAASVAARLQASGYEVATARDAPSGASAAVRQRPDLVILDVSTPGGGFSVAERILDIPLAPPVIFMTARGGPGLQQRALDIGAAVFFEKPYETEALLAAIRGALGEIGWGRRPETPPPG